MQSFAHVDILGHMTYRIPFGTHMKTFFLSILPNCCYLFVFFLLEFSDLSDFSVLLPGDYLTARPRGLVCS